MLFVIILLAHSWYPPECCSGKDCNPIASERVMEDGSGYFIDGGKFFVPHSQVRKSPDGGFHICEIEAKLRCFFSPPKLG